MNMYIKKNSSWKLLLFIRGHHALSTLMWDYPDLYGTFSFTIVLEHFVGMIDFLRYQRDEDFVT